jgi:hypothetical protein
MTRYQIKPADAGLAIEITEVGDKGDQLLAAFGECQAGQCSCPTNEYEKVEAMAVSPSEDEIGIELRARPGTQFNPEEIARCLDYTVERTAK